MSPGPPAPPPRLTIRQMIGAVPLTPSPAARALQGAVATSARSDCFAKSRLRPSGERGNFVREMVINHFAKVQ
jgi:hypothetical protein